jgi:hypothetical protein
LCALEFFLLFFWACNPHQYRRGVFLVKKVLEKIESFGIMKKRITFVSYLQKNGRLLIKNTSEIFGSRSA